MLHFAANMGGMGAIHSSNGLQIYTDNHLMTLNLLSAAVSVGVKLFFFASSACVYPENMQEDIKSDLALRESDVWNHSPPSPQGEQYMSSIVVTFENLTANQGLYGLEKLATELVLQQFASKLDIRIARFHNVYGPGGAWNNGREKAPAALIRKALATKLLGEAPPTMEMWGDGSQRRSFLWIEDCVEAIIRLLHSDYRGPLNIGSDVSITLKTLAEIALTAAGVNTQGVHYQCYAERPVGVASRNSDNTLVTRELGGWVPRTPLLKGMQKTARWIEAHMERMLPAMDHPSRVSVLREFQRSQVVEMKSEGIIFAILLPITSRSSNSPEDCLNNLRRFARSLERTTWRDVRAPGGLRFHIRVYLAVDHDDLFLGEGNQGNHAEAVLHDEGITEVITLKCEYPKGEVCSLWRRSCREAWKDGCDYFILLGDDVVLEDDGWMHDVHAAFNKMSSLEGVPQGFGTVAFTDTSFPGMPTFPVVHRVHMDIFEGEVVPKCFVNQDGDPFLFQLYRRWGCSTMVPSRLRNTVGGSDEARYEKKHAIDWTFEPLSRATRLAEHWLQKKGSNVNKKLTLDVVIPCYRVKLDFLTPILELSPSATCTVMFIIIIDNPDSPDIGELEHRYAHRPDVRIRVNKENLGASASRNRGLSESAAEYVHFLDDDVSPNPDLLVEAERIIRAHSDAAGFVGNSLFPRAVNAFTTSVHLAGVTYFWDIARKIEDDVPWGVTANLIARRDINDGVIFELCYPKTGGGEDIDFCRQKREASLQRGGKGFVAAPNVQVTHPWWNDGKRSYWRFYMWSVGDGALIKRYPGLSYRDFAPNSAELFS